MSASIAEVKAVLGGIRQDDRDRMIAAAASATQDRIARLRAALEGSNHEEAASLLSAELAVASLLEQVQGHSGVSDSHLEHLIGRL
jgi:hypothetical protein